MVYMLHGYERSNHRAVFQQLFRLRHQVFIKGRGWSLPSRNELEIDQYDNDDAVYFIDLDQSGNIQAHVRMTPTMRSSLIADYFPHLIETGADPRSPHIYEATRYMVLPTQKDKTHARLVKARFMAAVIEWCMEQRHTHMQTVIDAGTLSAYVEVSLLTTPLGLTHPFGGGKGAPGGGECMAFRWPIVDELLHDIKSYGAIQASEARLWQPMPRQIA